MRKRARKMSEESASVIAGGSPGEPKLASWEWGGVYVVQRPPDPQGILRVSIGGGEELPVSLNYCTFRGDREACIALLKKALDALRNEKTVKR